MHCSLGLEEEAEPHEVFVALGLLLVEGRVPRSSGTATGQVQGQVDSSGRGYTEGPHCPALGLTKPRPPHRCDTRINFLCRREEQFRKRMQLLWQSGVPMSVEVLACPECACGAQRALSTEPSVRPSPSDLLLERWTVAAALRGRGQGGEMGVRALLQAVRSQLFFSQLGAWLSASGGTAPRHVCYRLTVPGEVFASHFQQPPLEHAFPPVRVGPKHTIQVSVKSLPRGEGPPQVPICTRCSLGQESASLGSLEAAASGLSLQPAPIAPKDGATRRCRDEEAAALLGESLLDPPLAPLRAPQQMLQRPAIEQRDDLQDQEAPVDGIIPDEVQPERSGRQGLTRRRDRQADSAGCTKPGKHHCCQEDGSSVLDYSSSSSSTSKTPEPPLGWAGACGVSGCSKLSKGQELAGGKQDQSKLGKQLNLSQREVEEVLAVLRYRTRPISPPLSSISKGEADPLAVNMALGKCCSPEPLDITCTCTTPCCGEQQFKQAESKADKLLQAILRPSKQEPSSPHQLPSVQRPTGLERLKHLFNKTLSIPTSQQNSTNCAEGSSSRGPQVPSALDKAQFRRSLDSAASMVFRSGLPLTSSPAPLRRGTCFDFDSSLTSVQAIRSALFEAPGSPASSCEDPPSPCTEREAAVKPVWSPTSGALLGSFEESVLNGRLEPVSTVHGFTAELGASGNFCPKHQKLPVTVFFYTLGDNDKVSTPYLGHINLGRKGYVVPRSGTIQVTLFNPLGTVVKMFVVAYDLSDMPPNSQTFLRQRTLYLPAGHDTGTTEDHDIRTSLRYLIHLRFSSSKSGRISLHSDVRMIIFRKSDQDTASAHQAEAELATAHELRSFLSGPTNPKFSPRK